MMLADRSCWAES